MKKITELNGKEAASFFLKSDSYFNSDFPRYIGFDPILTKIEKILKGKDFSGFKKSKPENLSGVNYSFVASKDGRFAWRPLELMHPVIYVSLVNTICQPESWAVLIKRFNEFEKASIECCSIPVISEDHQSDKATQIKKWWQEVEQKSLCLSLEFSHILHTDVTDCYGSLYTHSITWALHGIEEAKKSKGERKLLGDKIDYHIRAGRYGQTNGISQGSVLMDFIAELVLGYADEIISKRLGKTDDFRILRYRDDYRIFTNSDVRAEEILKVISDALREVGMRLGTAKTFSSTNVVEGSIKPDKMACINLQDLGETNAITVQKQLLRLHSFCREFPNSGALRRLIGEFHEDIVKKKIESNDLEVQVAIVTDIAVMSPQAFPAIAGILSHLISLQDAEGKRYLWEKILKKIDKIPNNGYLQIWMQRITKPKKVGIKFHSDEPICEIINGKNSTLWNNDWIESGDLKQALKVSGILIEAANDVPETIVSDEIALFKKNAWY